MCIFNNSIHVIHMYQVSRLEDAALLHTARFISAIGALGAVGAGYSRAIPITAFATFMIPGEHPVGRRTVRIIEIDASSSRGSHRDAQCSCASD
jgi:hypothetical protein